MGVVEHAGIIGSLGLVPTGGLERGVHDRLRRARDLGEEPADDIADTEVGIGVAQQRTTAGRAGRHLLPFVSHAVTGWRVLLAEVGAGVGGQLVQRVVVRVLVVGEGRRRRHHHQQRHDQCREDHQDQGTRPRVALFVTSPGTHPCHHRGHLLHLVPSAP